MKQAEPFIYENVPLTFEVGGEQISGTLAGSYKWWQFHSDSPAFVRTYLKGVIGSAMLYPEIREEHHNIYNGIVEAGEALGYSFTEPEKEGDF